MPLHSPLASALSRSLRSVALGALAILAGSVGSLAQKLAPDFGRVPLAFEANHGQTDARVQFLSRGEGYALYLTPGEATLQLQKAAAKPQKSAIGTNGKPTLLAAPQSATLRMRLIGGNLASTANGEDLLPGTTNYFIGNDQSRWKTALPTYKRVSYKAVYPGVDLVYYGNQRQLEYDFVVAPGADAGKITLRFTGANPVIDAAGDLVLAVQGEQARFHKPVVYQLDGDRKHHVEGSYQIADGKVSFSLGAYDHSRALVIDPVLSYLTYLGGSAQDTISNIAVDSTGSVYVVGTTYSTDFPVKNAYQATNPHTIPSAPGAMFVSKFNATGTALVYSTYLGSTEYTYGNGIAVDSGGNAYVVGYTTYGTYPVTAGAYQTVCGAQFTQNGPTLTRINGCVGAGQGDSGGVLTKLNPTGTALAYSTYYSGDNGNIINAVAVDASGQAYVTGLTNTFNYSGVPSGPGDQCLPTTAGAVQTCELDSTGGGTRVFGFLAKFDAAAANLLYGTLLGPTTRAQSTTQGNAVAVDAAGFAYVGGVTNNNLYTTSGSYQAVSPNANGARAFAAKFDTVGKKIVYSTYVTGTNANSNVGEAVTGIAADAAGNAYLGGYTGDHSFPTTAGAYQTQTQSTNAPLGFVTKLNPTGSALVWSTTLGNAVGTGVTSGGLAYIYGLTLGTDGSVYVTGQTNGGGFPSVNPVFGVSYNFGFVSRVSADGSKLLFSTPFGDNSVGNSAIPYGVAVDPSGNIYFAGQTNGNSLPVTPGAFQAAHAGGNNGNYYNTGFVGKIAPTSPTTTTLTVSPATATLGQTVTFSATVAGPTGSSIVPTGTVKFLNGATTLGTGTVDATGKASFSATTLAPNTYSVVASYSGDGVYDPSASAAQSLVIAATGTSTGLTIAPAKIFTGQTAVATAVVSPASGTAIPTGTVTFSNGSTVLQAVAVDGMGKAIFTASKLAAGTYTITAMYSGDARFATSTSTAGTLVVASPLATAITLTASATTPALGSSITLSALVAPASGSAAATGTVTFKDGQTVLGTGTLDGSGKATFATAALALGAHTLTASYGGDAGDAGSVSTPLVVTVALRSTTTVLTASTTTPTVGASLVLTAQLAPATATGTVTFRDGTAVLGTGALNGTGTATYTTTTLALGVHTLTASYGGDAGDAGSTSAAVVVTVSPAPMITLGTTSGSVVAGKSVTTAVTYQVPGGFTGAATFACSGLPLNSSCTFAPASATVANGEATTTLTIATDVRTNSIGGAFGVSTGDAALSRSPMPYGSMPALALAALCGLGLAGRKKGRAGVRLFAALLAVIAIGGGLTGCGSTRPRTPAGASTVTITGTAGTSTSTANYQLTVTQ